MIRDDDDDDEARLRCGVNGGGGGGCGGGGGGSGGGGGNTLSHSLVTSVDIIMAPATTQHDGMVDVTTETG